MWPEFAHVAENARMKKGNIMMRLMLSFYCIERMLVLWDFVRAYNSFTEVRS